MRLTPPIPMPDPLPVNLPEPPAHQRLNLHAAKPILQASPAANNHTSAPHIAVDADVVIAGFGSVDAHPCIVEQGRDSRREDSQVGVTGVAFSVVS